MNEQEIERLVDKFERSSLNEMQISDNNFKLLLTKPHHSNATNSAAPVATSTPVQTAEAPTEDDAVVPAPLVGLVYLAAQPGKPVFKSVGDQVKAGDVVCLIEAMKVVNEVKSPYDGILREVLVEDGSLVEYDQPLFRIEKN
ncbi:biotin/lipoyl-containing protein [uncultured Secundilactobacillus sp.]|uniref:acetyl-CoA carboxylase biotin carboxyl carrier protein n=1 Tax=uncultured Secundilactobacillus sp. TaxID=2813935 RepID=UPI0025843A79|nr:biotin/lipoyl-containing protein [uncultured Secundilactobacillus sp.]